MYTVKLENSNVFGGRYVAYNGDEAVGFLEFHKDNECIKIHKLYTKRKREGIATLLIEQIYKDMYEELESKYLIATAAPDLLGPSKEECIESLIKKGIRVAGIFARYKEADTKRKEAIKNFFEKI